MPQPSPLTPARERAQALASAGDLAGARAMLERAVELGRINLSESDPDVLLTAYHLAKIHLRGDDPANARRVLEEAYAAGQWRLGDGDPLMVAISHDIGAVAEELGNRHEARKAFLRVAQFGPAALGAHHQAVARAQAYLGQNADPVRVGTPPPAAFPAPDNSTGPRPAAAAEVPQAGPNRPVGGAPVTAARPPGAPDAEGAGGHPVDRVAQPSTRVPPPDGSPAPLAAHMVTYSTCEAGTSTPQSDTVGSAAHPAAVAEPASARPHPIGSPVAHGAGAEQKGLGVGSAPPGAASPRADTPSGSGVQAGAARTSPGGVTRQTAGDALAEGAEGTAAGAPGPWGVVDEPTVAQSVIVPLPRTGPDHAQPPAAGARGRPLPIDETPAGSATGDEPPAVEERTGADSSRTDAPVAPTARSTDRYPTASPATVHRRDDDYTGFGPPNQPLWGRYTASNEAMPSGFGSAGGGEAHRMPGSTGSAGGGDAYSRKGLGVFAAIAAVLASLIAAVALVFVLADRVGVRGSPENVPTLAGAPPGDVRLRDEGSVIQLRWTDPSGGTVSFMVAMGHPGEQLRPVGTLGPGQTSYRAGGLNSRLNYCFAVIAVYRSDRFATSPQTCTHRATAASASSTSK